MQNGPRRATGSHQRRPAAPFGGRPQRWAQNTPRSEPKGSQNAQRSYERYLALAQAEALAGNTVGAENYYQHAEHYFRTMAADRGST
jgi:hypothetical protein